MTSRACSSTAARFLAGPNESQTIVVLVGESGSGKSTLTSILSRLIGQDQTGPLRTEHFRGRFEAAAFIGKQLLVGSDLDPRRWPAMERRC